MPAGPRRGSWRSLTNEELTAFQERVKGVWPMVEEQMGTEAYRQLIDFVEEYNQG